MGLCRDLVHKSNLQQLSIQQPPLLQPHSLLASAVGVMAPPAEERRYDYDGELYTKEEFILEYGGTKEWEAAERPPPVRQVQTRRRSSISVSHALQRPPPQPQQEQQAGASETALVEESPRRQSLTFDQV